MSFNVLAHGTILASAIRNAGTAYSTYLKVESCDRVVFMVDVSNPSGTTKFLDITVETTDAIDSSNAGALWYEIKTFAKIDTAGNFLLVVNKSDGFLRHLRLKNVISGSGTPKFTTVNRYTLLNER